MTVTLIEPRELRVEPSRLPRLMPGGWVGFPVTVDGAEVTLVIVQGLGVGVVDPPSLDAENRVLEWYRVTVRGRAGLLVYRLLRASRALMPAVERARLLAKVLAPLRVVSADRVRTRVRFQGHLADVELGSDVRIASRIEPRPTEEFESLMIHDVVYELAEREEPSLRAAGFDTRMLLDEMTAADEFLRRTGDMLIANGGE